MSWRRPCSDEPAVARPTRQPTWSRSCSSFGSRERTTKRPRSPCKYCARQLAQAQNTTARAIDDAEAARTAAIGALAGSGRLPQLIERANQELKKTPNSFQLHQNLADYYTAARQSDKARAELIKIAELRPEDTGLRLQIANQMAQNGQASLALEYYKTALKSKATTLLVRRAVSQMQTTLLQAGMAKELIALLEEIDLRLIGNALALGQLIQDLPKSPEFAEPARSLYRKTWNSFPDQRLQLLVYVYRDDIWHMPEMADYVRDAIIPKTLPPPRTALEWYLFMTTGPATNLTTGVLGSVEIEPPILRFVDMIEQDDRLNDVIRQVEAARKHFQPGHRPTPCSRSCTCGAGIMVRLKARLSNSLTVSEPTLRMRLPGGRLMLF